MRRCRRSCTCCCAPGTNSQGGEQYEPSDRNDAGTEVPPPLCILPFCRNSRVYIIKQVSACWEHIYLSIYVMCIGALNKALTCRWRWWSSWWWCSRWWWWWWLCRCRSPRTLLFVQKRFRDKCDMIDIHIFGWRTNLIWRLATMMSGRRMETYGEYGNVSHNITKSCWLLY